MTPAIGGATRVAAVIGDPVSHSRSPQIYNAAFEACGLDWVFTAFTVPAGGAARALRGARDLGLAGLSVTMPHKSDAASSCDELTPTASALGAVNTVVVRTGRLWGDSTDGAGFVASVEELGVEVGERSFLVLGAGGAARAIVHALGARGARVRVAARRAAAARTTAELAPGADAIPWGALADTVTDVDVVVNATPVGMHGEPPPFDVAGLRDRALVIDTVYHPAETPLLAAVRARGLRGVNGLGMLVHQAARIFELLTGREAPLEVMRSAAEQ